MTYILNILATLILIPWPAVILMSPMMIASKDFAKHRSDIFMAMAFFGYPVLLFLLIKLLGFRFYGTEPLSWALGFFAASAIISLVYGLPRMLWNIKRGIPNEGYYKTEKRVYWYGRIIKGADPATFKAFDKEPHHFSKDARQVYIRNKRLRKADATTFGPLGDDMHYYWKDCFRVYTVDKLLPQAHSTSFEYLGQGYARDRANVFYLNQLIEKADRDTFRVLESNIGRDHCNVYAGANPATRIKDLKSFELVNVKDEWFGRDQEHIYAIFHLLPHPFEPFPGADQATFEPLGDHYARDKKQVYHYSFQKGIRIVQDARPESFQLTYDSISGADAHDGNMLFRAGEALSRESDLNPS